MLSNLSRSAQALLGIGVVVVILIVISLFNVLQSPQGSTAVNLVKGVYIISYPCQDGSTKTVNAVVTDISLSTFSMQVEGGNSVTYWGGMDITVQDLCTGGTRTVGRVNLISKFASVSVIAYPGVFFTSVEAGGIELIGEGYPFPHFYDVRSC